MKTNKLLKSTTILMISVIALVSSCNDEERITVKDTQDITEEALTDSYFQDMDDMAGVAVQSDQATAGGRVPVAHVPLLFRMTALIATALL